MDEIGQEAFSHLAFRLEVINKFHPLRESWKAYNTV